MGNLTDVEIYILETSKREDFHISLQKIIDRDPSVDSDEIISAFRNLVKKRIVSKGSDLLNDYFGVTNYGWKIMGWR